jgi:hypothetical protein
MTSYAPLLAKDGHNNWNPDMIYFSNTEVRVTPSYNTQRIFSVFSGDQYIESTVNADDAINNRVVASIVEDRKSQRRYLKVVNALPTPLTLKIDGITLPTTMKYEGFQGKPDDQQTTPVQGSVTPSDGTLTLPSYSLTVYEL